MTASHLEQNSNAQYDVETKFVDTSERGEGSCHRAKHIITDRQNNITLGVTETNKFDFGYQVHTFSRIDFVEDGDWVDISAKITNIKTPDVDKINQKIEIENPLNSEDNGSIDLVFWNDSGIKNISEGDYIIVSSVVVDTFDGEMYLSFNSNSEATQFDTKSELENINKSIKSFVKTNNCIKKTIRM